MDTSKPDFKYVGDYVQDYFAVIKDLFPECEIVSEDDGAEAMAKGTMLYDLGFVQAINSPEQEAKFSSWNRDLLHSQLLLSVADVKRVYRPRLIIARKPSDIDWGLECASHPHNRGAGVKVSCELTPHPKHLEYFQKHYVRN
jgi:hypothetical protein